MSLRLQGKIIRFPLMEYAKSLNIDISDRAISPLKLLWLALADFQNEKSGQCNPSIKTLSTCIEKSESQTTVYMGMLKKLGLVIAAKNAKGGRYTPQYDLPIPSYPMDKGAKPPEDDSPQKYSGATPIAHTNQGSCVQDATPVNCRTRILIEPLDEPLIKALINERNIYIKNQGLARFGKKYGFPFMENTPMHEVETWFVKAINASTLHGISYGNH